MTLDSAVIVYHGARFASLVATCNVSRVGGWSWGLQVSSDE